MKNEKQSVVNIGDLWESNYKTESFHLIGISERVKELLLKAKSENKEEEEETSGPEIDSFLFKENRVDRFLSTKTEPIVVVVVAKCKVVSNVGKNGEQMIIYLYQDNLYTDNDHVFRNDFRKIEL